MRNAGRNAGYFGLLAVLTGACAVQVGSQPAAAPQAVPPPQAFAHPGFVYYSAGAPIPAPPRMPPAVSRPVRMNTAHLQLAAAQPSRCNIPKEVAPGVFVHMDCFPYRRVAVAIKHATPSKINLMQRNAVRWLPLRRAEIGALNPMDPFADNSDPNAPQFIFAGNTAAPTAPPLPDLVDHRLNGTEGPIKDQGDVGACTAFGLSSVMDNSLRRAGLNITTSPEHVWSHYATPTMEDAASGNLNKGVTTFDALPYSGKEACEIDTDTTDDCGETYGVLPNTARADAPLEQKIATANAASGHRITSFQELNISPPNIDEVVSTLASGADIWAGFNIDSSVWVNRRMQNFVIPDWSSPDGGHAIDIAGYRKANGGYQFLIHNSWGPSWGDQGYAWISQAMVSKWMHLAYKVTTDTDPGAPGSTVAAQTDDDCPGDQLLDSVTNKCTPICTDDTRPANGMCPNGPPPPPQSLQLPAIPGFNGIPGIPAIPGFSIPGLTPTPAPAASGQQQQAAPQGAQPFTIPSAWPWPVPSTLPNFLPPPQK